MEENGIQINLDLAKAMAGSQVFGQIFKMQGREESTSTDYYDATNDIPDVFASEILSSEPTLKLEVGSRKSPFTQTFFTDSLADSVESQTDSMVAEFSGTFFDENLPEITEPESLTDVTERVANFISTTTPNLINASVESLIRSNVTNASLPGQPTGEEWVSHRAAIIFIAVIIVFFIAVGNVFVIISVYRFRILHTPTNYFIMSLAFVDILVAIAAMAVVTIELVTFSGEIESPDSVVIYLLPNRFLMMTCGVSLLTLATIAYDRHKALAWPLEYINIMTSKKVAIMVAITWIYSALIVWLPLVFGWYDVTDTRQPHSVNLIHGKAHALFLAAIFLPSGLAILVFYFRIFIVARHHAKAIAAVETSLYRGLQAKFMKKDKKYAKTLAVVIGVFFALWLPFLVCLFIDTLREDSFGVWLYTFLILLAVLNSGINPWIYAFKNNEFKAAFSKLFPTFLRVKLCFSRGPNGSLMPWSNGTPRLSRTDSRMVATIFEPTTLGATSERLKRSLDSLDQFENELGSLESVNAVPSLSKTNKVALRDRETPSISTVDSERTYHDTISYSDFDQFEDSTAESNGKAVNARRRQSADFLYEEKSSTYDIIEVVEEEDHPTACVQTESQYEQVESPQHSDYEDVESLRHLHQVATEIHRQLSCISVPVTPCPLPIASTQRTSSWSLPATPTRHMDVPPFSVPRVPEFTKYKHFVLDPKSVPNQDQHNDCLKGDVTHGVPRTPPSTPAMLSEVTSSPTLQSNLPSTPTDILPVTSDLSGQGQTNMAYSPQGSLTGDCSDSGVFDCHDSSASFHPYFQQIPNSYVSLFDHSGPDATGQMFLSHQACSCSGIEDLPDSFAKDTVYVSDDVTVRSVVDQDILRS